MADKNDLEDLMLNSLPLIIGCLLIKEERATKHLGVFNKN